jgi:capsule polysaccharide export protein KpsE/RkpR
MTEGENMASLQSVNDQAAGLQATAALIVTLISDLRAQIVALQEQLAQTGTISESDLDPLAASLQAVQDALNGALA